jgi:hypothetical protein
MSGGRRRVYPFVWCSFIAMGAPSIPRQLNTKSAFWLEVAPQGAESALGYAVGNIRYI